MAISRDITRYHAIFSDFVHCPAISRDLKRQFPVSNHSIVALRESASVANFGLSLSEQAKKSGKMAMCDY